MSKREPIRYKDTLAMPGSRLFEILTDTKDNPETRAAKAAESYKETNNRYFELMKEKK